MVDLNLVSIGLGIIATLIGIGWKIAHCMNEIRMSVVRIETILTATSARLDKLELEVNEIKKELRWEHK
jgi:RecA/RadA recombinase